MYPSAILSVFTTSKPFGLFQFICSSHGNICASNITTKYAECLPPCEGVYADVTKIQAEKIEGEYYENLMKEYHEYKRFYYPSESNLMLPHFKLGFWLFSGFQIPSKLRFVNIFFDTPTFDRITKDKSAKVLNKHNM